MSEIVVVPLSDLQELIDGILTRRLKPIEDKLLYAPDTTPISDEEAAMKLNVSVSTIGRWKKSLGHTRPATSSIYTKLTEERRQAMARSLSSASQ